MDNSIKKFYIKDRTKLIDPDFLEFEEDMIEAADSKRIIELLESQKQDKIPNKHNSILLYVIGLSDEFDFDKGRSDMVGGSAPDIDLDYSQLGKDALIEKVVEKWGREHVANIITLSTFKPKGILERWGKLAAPHPDNVKELQTHYALVKDIRSKIPPPLFGKEPNFNEIINGSEKKSYPAHPELLTDPKYKSFMDFATYIEGMVSHFSFHPAGLIISTDPIWNHIPIWKNSKSEYITQFDMNECEELGCLKFDFLTVVNLDIIQQCLELIKKERKIDIELGDHLDFDEKTYKVLEAGYLSGIFQFETSAIMKDLITSIKPKSISDLSDISALCRPGPLSAGFDKTYLENRNNRYPPEDMPKCIAEILQESHWTLLYQESVMAICNKLAGFTLKESDDIRRSLGKKKIEVLEPYKIQFIEGFKNYGLTQNIAKKWWKIFEGCSDYIFNRSHSISYAFISYYCAYLKANYPHEFFTALMSVRAVTEQPKQWAIKAPEYVQEAKIFDIDFMPPDINMSGTKFKIIENKIYFGLACIKGLGNKTCKLLLKERKKNGTYVSLWDLISRTSISTGTLQSLIHAGALDCFGFSRASLLDNLSAIANYHKEVTIYNEHIVKQAAREKESAEIQTKQDELIKLIKDAKTKYKTYKKDTSLLTEKEIFLLDKKNINSLDKDTIYEEDWKNDLVEYSNLRKLPLLKDKLFPQLPTLNIKTKNKLTVSELILQADHIGCYLSRHPAGIVFPDAITIDSVQEGEYNEVAGAIVEARILKTKKGPEMAILSISDATGIAKIVLFPYIYKIYKDKIDLSNSTIIKVFGEVKQTDTTTEIIAKSISQYRSMDE